VITLTTVTFEFNLLFV